MAHRRLLVIIPASLLGEANEAAQAWDGAATNEEFMASSQTFGGLGISADGKPPSTHFGCSTVLSESNATKAVGLLKGLKGPADWALLRGPDPSGPLMESSLAALAAGEDLDFDRFMLELGLFFVGPAQG